MHKNANIPEVGERFYVVNPYPNHPDHQKNADGSFDPNHSKGLDFRNYPTRLFDGNQILQGEVVEVRSVTSDAVTLTLITDPYDTGDRVTEFRVGLDKFTLITNNNDLAIDRRDHKPMGLERAREIVASMDKVANENLNNAEIISRAKKSGRKFDHEYAGNFATPEMLLLFKAAVVIAKSYDVPVDFDDIHATAMVRRKIERFVKEKNLGIDHELSNLIPILSVGDKDKPITWDPNNPANK